MICIALHVDLYLPGRTSLKEKRQTLRAIVDGVAPKFGAAVAEVGQQDVWQAAQLGFALIGGTPSEVRARAESLVERLRQRIDIEVVAVRAGEFKPGDEA